MLTVGGLTMDFGEQLLFDQMNFEVQPGDRIGLIGVNGSGKTTLFKLLTGQLSPTKGSIVIHKNVSVGYMEQHVCRHLERSAYDEVLTNFSDLMDMEAELEGLHALIAARQGDIERMVERQAFLQEELLRKGGLTYRSRSRSALLGLGFDDEKMNLPIRSLSGGQRAKLQLAKLLLSPANLLLLDEPTNHLDTASVEWLESFLLESGSSYIVISHDRYFLDKTTNKTFELEHKKMTRYHGNYSAYLPQKQEHELSLQRAYDNTMREITRLEGIVQQQRQWNREKNIRTAESKQKAIGRLQSTLQRPESAPDSIHFGLSSQSQSGEDVLMVKKLALSFGETPLFRDVSFDIHRGERIFLLGPNGCGKTSLLRLLLGQLSAQSGSVRFGVGVKPGYYDQIQTGMDSEKTVFEEISDRFPAMTNTEIRSTLARFLFKNDDVFKPLCTLSGGERARVLLAELMLGGFNFLLLDEPTNHLDIHSVAALQQALKDYDGTLFIVSHDRYLINALADKIFYLSPKGIEVFTGNYEDYLAKAQPFAKAPASAEKPVEGRQSEYKKKRENDARRRRDRARLTRLEAEIARAETRHAEVEAASSDPSVTSDYQRLMSLTEEMASLEQEIEALYEEWSELSEALES